MRQALGQALADLLAQGLKANVNTLGWLGDLFRHIPSE